MYLIKCLFLVSLIILCHTGCLKIGDSGISNEEYEELCPYERKLSGRDFYVETPLYIVPHKPLYKVGDTITVKLELSDSIFDLSREMKFKVKDFPFNPNYHLYLVDEEGWHTGLARTTVITDSTYSHRVLQARIDLAGSVAGTSVYQNGTYTYIFKYVLKEPGRYVSLVTDRANSISKEDLNLYPEYEDVSNSANCPNTWHQVCYILQGDPYYAEFADEMRFVDEEVYRERLVRLEGKDDYIWGGDRATMAVDWHAVMGFEVVE